MQNLRSAAGLPAIAACFGLWAGAAVFPAVADGLNGGGSQSAVSDTGVAASVTRFPAVEVLGSGGENSSEVAVQAAIPLSVTTNRMWFLGADVSVFERGLDKLGDSINFNGSTPFDVGTYLGLREVMDGGRVAGLWVGFDIQQTVFDNTFSRAIAGVSLDTERLIVRASGFIPFDQEKGSETEGIERTSSGLDGDIMVRFPFASILRPGGLDEFRAGVGGYHYFDLLDSDDLSGYRLRAELDFWTPGVLSDGSRLSFETEYAHDSERDSQWKGGLRLAIPFRCEAPVQVSLKDGPSSSPQTFGTPVRRNRDIVTSAKSTVVTNACVPSGGACTADADCCPGPPAGFTGCFANACGTIFASDRRLKMDVVALGLTRDGYSIYRWRYVPGFGPAGGDDQVYVGVMAQDIIATRPEAVVTASNGFYGVRYDLLGLRMARLEEWQQFGAASVSAKFKPVEAKLAAIN